MGTNGDANAAGVAACTGIPMRRIEGTRLSTIFLMNNLHF
jgi:hypothetical protein